MATTNEKKHETQRKELQRLHKAVQCDPSIQFKSWFTTPKEYATFIEPECNNWDMVLHAFRHRRGISITEKEALKAIRELPGVEKLYCSGHDSGKRGRVKLKLDELTKFIDSLKCDLGKKDGDRGGLDVTQDKVYFIEEAVTEALEDFYKVECIQSISQEERFNMIFEERAGTL